MELTKHAAQAMTKRVIALEWVEKAVTEPELRIPDPSPDYSGFRHTEACNVSSARVLG